VKEPKFRSVGKINPASDKVLNPAVVIDMSEVDLAGFLADLEELHPSLAAEKIMLTAEETALPYQRRALDCARGRLLLYRVDPYVVMDVDMEEKPRPYTVFVEPQDYEAYKKAGHASIVVLPENEKGIAYARQAILDYAIQNNDKWFWMIDNDVIQFSAYQLDGYVLRKEPLFSRPSPRKSVPRYANDDGDFVLVVQAALRPTA
jgi:hypothetical protein